MRKFCSNVLLFLLCCIYTQFFFFCDLRSSPTKATFSGDQTTLAKATYYLFQVSFSFLLSELRFLPIMFFPFLPFPNTLFLYFTFVLCFLSFLLAGSNHIFFPVFVLFYILEEDMTFCRGRRFPLRGYCTWIVMTSSLVSFSFKDV